MAKDGKKTGKDSQNLGSDKKMKTLSKAVAKQVSTFYKKWFKTAETNSFRKVEH